MSELSTSHIDRIVELERERDAAQQQLKIRIDQFTAERTRAERAERRAAVLEERLGQIDSPEWRGKVQEAISKSPTAFAASRLAVEIIDEMTAIAKKR